MSRAFYYAVLLILFAFSASLAWPADAPLLDVQVVPTGGVRAKATVLFPVQPELIQRLLTDYRHWPDLFDVRMRLVDLHEQDGRAVTDLRISHTLLPGERRLLCESRTVAGGGLLTELKGGDFKQYRRVWTLHPVEDGARTQADFELLVEIDTMVPDWMVAIAMKQELESHFRIVREKALDLARSEPVK